LTVSTLKKETSEEKKEMPASTPGNTQVIPMQRQPLLLPLQKFENAESLIKSRVSPSKKTDPRSTVEKPAATPKVDHASIDAGKSLLTTSDV
jgi:hypothetical protein